MGIVLEQESKQDGLWLPYDTLPIETPCRHDHTEFLQGGLL